MPSVVPHRLSDRLYERPFKGGGGGVLSTGGEYILWSKDRHKKFAVSQKS